MPDINPELIAAKERAEADLLGLPGVTGVDVGYKEVGGQPTQVVAIRVLVAEKKSRDKVPAAARIPAEIEGHPTDVIERRFELHALRKPVAELAPEADTGTYAPLKGGISLGPCRSVNGFVYVGTLGAIVRDNATGNPMMLSNFHVMCIDNGFHIGDTQAQPGLVDGGVCPAGVVGTLARQSLGGSVDCAAADITASRGTACEIVDVGAITGTNTVSLGATVRKRGRTTGLTYGIVDSISLSVNIDYGPGLGTKTLTGQIGVKPDPAHNAKFGDHGDSGSVVVNGANEVVGLHFAGDPTGYGIANPIAAVLSALNVSMCQAKSLPKDPPKDLPHKDLPKDPPKDFPKDPPHKDLPKDLPKDPLHKDPPKDLPKDPPHKDLPKDPPKDFHKDLPKDAALDPPKGIFDPPKGALDPPFSPVGPGPIESGGTPFVLATPASPLGGTSTLGHQSLTGLVQAYANVLAGFAQAYTAGVLGEAGVHAWQQAAATYQALVSALGSSGTA